MNSKPALRQEPDFMKDILRHLLKLQELQFGDSRVAGVNKAMSSLRRKIPAPILDHFDRLAAKGKKGVAIVRNQVCGGCHMRIPIGAIVTLMHGEDIRTCDTCARYLYLPEDEKCLEVDTDGRAAGGVTTATPRDKPLNCVA